MMKKPVSEEHSSTETTETKKKRPFLRHEASRRKLTSTFPRHSFIYLIKIIILSSPIRHFNMQKN